MEYVRVEIDIMAVNEKQSLVPCCYDLVLLVGVLIDGASDSSGVHRTAGGGSTTNVAFIVARTTTTSIGILVFMFAILCRDHG